jgi:hypothetical protein
LAEARLKEGTPRDAVAALLRVRELKPGGALAGRADRLARAIDAKAKPGAAELLPKVRANADGSWVDAFLAYRDDFEFADGARELMAEFAKLRARHEAPAKAAFAAARTAFQQGKQDEGYAKYQEIVDKHYASSLYRNVKMWQEARKK